MGEIFLQCGQAVHNLLSSRHIVYNILSGQIVYIILSITDSVLSMF